jgi:hypothetical protein
VYRTDHAKQISIHTGTHTSQSLHLVSKKHEFRCERWDLWEKALVTNPHLVLGDAPAISGSDEVFSLLFAVASSVSFSFLAPSREKTWLTLYICMRLFNKRAQEPCTRCAKCRKLTSTSRKVTGSENCIDACNIAGTVLPNHDMPVTVNTVTLEAPPWLLLPGPKRSGFIQYPHM